MEIPAISGASISLTKVLNRLRNIKLVHLQAGWFMQDLSRWVDAIGHYHSIGWTLKPNVKTPRVAIEDIANFAAKEFDTPTDQHRSVKQLGVDYTMSEIATMVGRALSREVNYRFVDPDDRKIETEFRERTGTLDRWVYDRNTAAALNDGRVKLMADRPALRTTMEEFVKSTLRPLIEKARTDSGKPESFLTWISRR